MKTPKIENYDYSRARPHHPKPRQNRRSRAAGLANRMCSHWQGVSAAGGERSVGHGRRRACRCAPAHRCAQAPGARRRGSAQRAARLPAQPAAPQATQTVAGRVHARAARPEGEKSGVEDGVEHHQSISSCSCVPAEDRWAPGRTQPTNESTIPVGCQGPLAALIAIDTRSRPNERSSARDRHAARPNGIPSRVGTASEHGILRVQNARI
jgi:hypothetical protein